MFSRSQYIERNPEQEDIQKNLLHNAALPINQLPIEILIKIITLSFAKPHTELMPYPCLIFSWVCHHWRSVVLGNPTFWNRIVVWEGNMIRPVLKAALMRSRTLPLDVTAYDIDLLIDELGSDANRVGTLRIAGYSLSFSYLTSHFSLLTKLFIENYGNDTDLPIKPLPLLQALQVAIKDLGNLAMPSNFPNLWWLRLKYDISMPFIPLLEALQNLPCLRVLHLFPSKNRWTVPQVPTRPTIAFHRLEALITGAPILQLITAPKLLYLECSLYPKDFFKSKENYDHFSGYNFSKITHIQCEMNADEDICIMGKFKADAFDNMIPFLDAQDDRTLDFEEPTSFYPNEFYIKVDASSATDPLALLSVFSAVVRKSNNLNEIILNNLNFSSWTRNNDEERNCFLDALRCAKEVRNLTASGDDFGTLCGYLHDRSLCPSLEKLFYFTREKQDFLDSLLKLMSERNTTGPRPLEVELAGFPPVPLEALKPAEELGLRLIQKPGKPPRKRPNHITDFLEAFEIELGELEAL